MRPPSLSALLESKLLKRITGSDVAQSTLWMLSGQGIRLIVQAAYFTILARVLGTAGYGAFVGVAAMAAIAAPFAGFGTGVLLIQRVARNRETFPQEWARALLMSVTTGSLLALLLGSAGRLFLPATIPTALIACVVVSDLVFGPLTGVSAQCFQAVGRLSRMAQLQLQWSVIKLVAAVILVSRPLSAPLVWWGILYLAAGILAAAVAVLIVVRKLGLPRFRGLVIRTGLGEGGFFAVSDAAKTVYDDIDKTMLVRLSTLEATGLYGAAYRVVDLSFAPVRALLTSVLPQFFRHGAGGVRAAFAYGRRYLPVAIGYSALVWLGLSLTAPVLPLVLGQGFSESVAAVRWLAIIPLLKTLQYFVADALTGSGFQSWRTGVQVVVAGGNIAANLWLIPRYGWRGAAWASLGSDSALALGLWCVLYLAGHREDRQMSASLSATALASERQ